MTEPPDPIQKRRRLRNMMLRILLYFACLPLALGALLVIFQNKLMYFASRYPETLKPGGRGAERFHPFASAEGKTQWGYLIEPGRDGKQPQGKPSFYLVFGGNASTAMGLAPLFEALAHETGCGFFLADFRGYGFNDGSPTEPGITADALAAYDALEKEGRFKDGAGLIGISLGGGAAFAVAEMRPVARLLTISTFTSMNEMVREVYFRPLDRFCWNRWPNERRLREIAGRGEQDRPREIIVMHGTHDELIPVAMGKRLAAAAPGLARFIPIERAGHNDALDSGYKSVLEVLSANP